MQKWGTNRNGSVRFHCGYCLTTQTRKRSDLVQKYRKERFISWLLSKLSLVEIAEKQSISLRTIHTWFTPFWNDEPLPKSVSFSGQVIIIDGKYVDQNACVLIASTAKSVISWQFTQRETMGSWYQFMCSLQEFPFAIVSDGQRGMLKAIKLRFPGVIIQRCQFHVIQYCLTKLTKRPETQAAWELRQVVTRIAKVKTKEQFKEWLEDYIVWRKTYHEFLKERTYQEDSLTPMGRRKWHYTHGRLHATHSHLKNALPNLFKYLLYPQIPNTSNYIEGAINSQMQEKLRFHRGLKLPKRRILIAHHLASKQ